MNTYNELPTIYTVIITEDYANNGGDPASYESHQFDTFEEAKAVYESELTEITTANGITRTVDLYEGNEDNVLDNQLFTDYCKSAPLPADSILVFFRHHRYMNYAYDIVEVREAFEKTYEELPYSDDTLRSTWCQVYESKAELEEAYLRNWGIFEKINKGSSLVREYLELDGVTTNEDDE